MSAASEAAAVRARVGWIGLGRIGTPMAERVRAAGWPLTLWARRREAAQALLSRDEGAPENQAERQVERQGERQAERQGERQVEWAAGTEALARRCDIICTIVTGPQEVQELHAALMPHARPGTLFIDLTTAAPATALAAAQRAAAFGHASIEAPVSGGVGGAERGALTCYIGGEAAAVQRARPLLAAFGKELVHCGAAGSGYRTKLLNQTLMAGVLMGLADGARLARAAGLTHEVLMPALAGGTARSFLLESYLPRMMAGGGPVTFTLGLLLKDLRLARHEAESSSVNVPLLDAAIAAVAAAAGRHGADAGVQALANA